MGHIRKSKQSLVGSYNQNNGGCGAFIFLILFSLPFIGAGIFAVLIYLGYIEGKVNGPREIMLAVAALFGGAGLFIFFKSFSSLFITIKRKQLQKMYPDEQWNIDFPEGGELADRLAGNSLRGSLAGIFFVGCFEAIILFIMKKDPSIILYVIASILGIIIIAITIHMILTVLRRLKYGSSFLQMQTFPAFCGEAMRASLQANINSTVNKLELFLRCYTDEIHRNGKNSNTVNIRLYEDSQIISESFTIDATTPPIPVSFDIPADCHGTRLYHQTPYYWELEVRADTPGVDYHAAFLLPVYNKK